MRVSQLCQCFQLQLSREPRDILSLIMRARTEDGSALSDRELRDELLTLILAGFETTANSLAWTWERLVRAPAAYARLREVVRRDGSAVSAESELRGHYFFFECLPLRRTSKSVTSNRSMMLKESSG